jgi:hypothetical protein
VLLVLSVVFAMSMTRTADAICGPPAPGRAVHVTVSDVSVKVLRSSMFVEIEISGDTVINNQDRLPVDLEGLPLTATVLHPSAAGCCYSDLPPDGSTVATENGRIVTNDAGDPVAVSLGGHCRGYGVSEVPAQLSYVAIPDPIDGPRQAQEEHWIVGSVSAVRVSENQLLIGLVGALVFSASVTWGLGRRAAARSTT